VIYRQAFTVAGLLALGVSMICPSLADEPPPASEVPLYDRYQSTQAYLRGGLQEHSAYDAERNRIPGADDSAVLVTDGPDGTHEVTFQLEIAEVQQEVYPGKRVLFWVYAPLGAAMTSNVRLPSPTLRVEEGDRVRIILYNTHYFPHTLHLHGVNLPYEMDGVPNFSQAAVAPGHRFVYEFTAQQPGTYWYHCHVNPSVHMLMGLSGMFIIEPKRPDNHFARLIVGAGRIGSIGKATAEMYQGEYSLVYQDVDERLNRIALAYTDAREIEMRMHRDYDSTQRKPNIFLLNGFSSPYSLKDTPILVKQDESTKLRILNIGGLPIYFHPHGHHPTLTDMDGDPVPPAAQYSRDTFTVGPAQRLDLALNTSSGGRAAAGPGVWMVHDHDPIAETNAGIDGGAMTAIVYDGFMGADGLPKSAEPLSPMFDRHMNAGAMPTFDPKIFGTDAARYRMGWPSEQPLGGSFDYPHRDQAADALPRLDLIERERHKPVAASCADKPRSELQVHIKAGTRYAHPGETFGFEPRELHLARCAAVTVVFENTDEVRHSFMIPGLTPLFAINLIGPGSATAAFVTPDKDVTLLFHCHVSTHERHGLLGELIIGKGGPLDREQSDGMVRFPGAAALRSLAESQPAHLIERRSTSFVTGFGSVISTNPEKSLLVMEADAIPGYMAAMTMSYATSSAARIEGLKPQDRIQFTVDRATGAITSVKLLARPH
jgi:FtsP/CotA-like multicopper oxidase with cupredoxin domain